MTIDELSGCTVSKLELKKSRKDHVGMRLFEASDSIWGPIITSRCEKDGCKLHVSDW